MKNIEKLYEKRNSEIEKGKQFNMTAAARELGFPLPVYVTSELKNKFIEPDSESRDKGEDEKTRFKQVLDKLIYVIRIHRQKSKSNIIRFDVSLTVEGKSRKIDLVSYLGQIDSENKDPSITLALADEIH